MKLVIQFILGPIYIILGLLLIIRRGRLYFINWNPPFKPPPQDFSEKDFVKDYVKESSIFTRIFGVTFIALGILFVLNNIGGPIRIIDVIPIIVGLLIILFGEKWDYSDARWELKIITNKKFYELYIIISRIILSSSIIGVGIFFILGYVPCSNKDCLIYIIWATLFIVFLIGFSALQHFITQKKRINRMEAITNKKIRKLVFILAIISLGLMLSLIGIFFILGNVQFSNKDWLFLIGAILIFVSSYVASLYATFRRKKN